MKLKTTIKTELRKFEEYTLKKGRMEKTIEIAHRMNMMGLDARVITETTGLDEGELAFVFRETPGPEEQSGENMVEELLERRHKVFRETLAELLQEDKTIRHTISRRMAELGFDRTAISDITGLPEREAGSCDDEGNSSSPAAHSSVPAKTSTKPYSRKADSLYETIAQTGIFRLALKPLKDRKEIYNLLTSSTPIDRDYGFLLDYEGWSTYKELETARLFAILFKLYGPGDQVFDGWKASFNYTFLMELTYRDNKRQRKVTITTKVCDLKGYQDIGYWRSKKITGGTRAFIDEIIRRGDLNICTLLLCGHFHDLFEKHKTRGFEEFELYQQYLHKNYGYKNGAFFEERSLSL